MTWDKVLSYPRGGVSFTSFGIHSTHFLVHLHFNVLSSLPAIFATRIATEVECYQFSCHFAVPEKTPNTVCF